MGKHELRAINYEERESGAPEVEAFDVRAGRIISVSSFKNISVLRAKYNRRQRRERERACTCCAAQRASLTASQTMQRQRTFLEKGQ